MSKLVLRNKFFFSYLTQNFGEGLIGSSFHKVGLTIQKKIKDIVKLSVFQSLVLTKFVNLKEGRF
jgi:hypothetical protein